MLKSEIKGTMILETQERVISPRIPDPVNLPKSMPTPLGTIRVVSLSTLAPLMLYVMGLAYYALYHMRLGLDRLAVEVPLAKVLLPSRPMAMFLFHVVANYAGLVGISGEVTGVPITPRIKATTSILSWCFSLLFILTLVLVPQNRIYVVGGTVVGILLALVRRLPDLPLRMVLVANFFVAACALAGYTGWEAAGSYVPPAVVVFTDGGPKDGIPAALLAYDGRNYFIRTADKGVDVIPNEHVLHMRVLPP